MSLVGARVRYSPLRRSFMISAVTIIPAATELFPFFFDISSTDSRMTLAPPQRVVAAENRPHPIEDPGRARLAHRRLAANLDQPQPPEDPQSLVSARLVERQCRDQRLTR